MLARDVLPFLPNVGVEHPPKIRAITSRKLGHYHIPLHAQICVIFFVCQKVQPPCAKRHHALYGSHHQLYKLYFHKMVSIRLHLMNCLNVMHCLESISVSKSCGCRKLVSCGRVL